MANKISVILDVATDKAVSGLKGFKQSVAEADGAVGKMKAGAGSAFDSIKANAGLMGVAVAGAVGTMAAKSIEAASKLGESVNAVNVTFGKSAEGIKALGEDAAESVGLSNAAFNSLAVQFSSFAETVAGDGGDVVGTMDEMTTRIADFASVMNLDVADAAAIFQSSLAGETESIRRFGIDLSAATVESFAYANGIGKVGTKLTETEKVQARYALLMRETNSTAGDFANTSDGLANSQRILAAKMEDTAAKVGEDLAPALAAVTTMLADVIPVAGKMAVGVGKAFTAMTDAAYEFGRVVGDLADLIPGIDLPGLQEGIEHTVHDFEKLEQNVAANIEAWQEGVETMDAFVAKLEKMGLSQDTINLAMAESKFSLDENKAALEAAAIAEEELAEATDETTTSTEKSTLAHWDAEESIKAIEDADKDAEDAARARTEAIDDQVESLRGLVGGDIAVRDAQREAAQAMRDLTLAMEEGDLSSEELAAQTDATALELIGAAEAAAGYDENLANANGKILTAAEKNDLLRDKLIQVADTLAPGSPLRLQLDGYISDLDRIPSEIGTRVFITGTGAAGSHQGPVRGSFASGGVVPGPVGAPQLIVAHGGEEFLGVNGSNGNGHGHTLNFYSSGPPSLADLAHAFAMLRLTR